MEEKNLEKDRLVFFCDAVVAIAITLLIIDLKIEQPADGHITFPVLLQPWHQYVAFLLSFFNIANFWKTHHAFYSHIQKINERFLWYNIFWLFFIVFLPFTTSLISTYLFDAPAMFLYCFNTFMITVFQNFIWDYVTGKPDYLKENSLDAFTNMRFMLYCNLDMLNAVLAVIVSFINPALAFILLLTKLPMFITTRIYLRWKYRKEVKR